MSEAKRGEGWAFTTIFDAWSRPLTAFVAARGVTDVDDVVSEIFLGVFRSIGSFEGSESDFRSWIFRIARNKVADSFRSSGRQPVTIPLSPQRDIVGGDVEGDAFARLGVDRVAELLNGLTDDQSEVLLLRIIGDLSVADVAELMDRRPGAIKQLQRRALRRLELRLVSGEFATETRTPRAAQGR
ncbi:MAG: sigma-70 family RNA polymerase sigma factor [Actinomycetota bacterium]